MAGPSAPNGTSFKRMVEMHREVTKIVGEDPAVNGVGLIHQRQQFWRNAQRRHDVCQPETPLDERDGAWNAQRVIRAVFGTKSMAVPGLGFWMFPAAGSAGREAGRGNSQYRFTLWSADFDELIEVGAAGTGTGEAGARHRRRVERPRRRRPATRE